MKKHWPLILGVGVPAVFLLGVLGVALLPSLGPKPEHDILLAGRSQVGYDYRRPDYLDVIEDGKLVRKVDEEALRDWEYGGDGARYQVRREPNPERVTTLYRYSVADRSVREISFADAQRLSLDPGPTSEDGFSVGGAGYRSDGIFELFGSRGGSGARLAIYRDGRKVDEVILPTEGYYEGPSFLAWIE